MPSSEAAAPARPAITRYNFGARSIFSGRLSRASGTNFAFQTLVLTSRSHLLLKQLDVVPAPDQRRPDVLLQTLHTLFRMGSRFRRRHSCYPLCMQIPEPPDIAQP